MDVVVQMQLMFRVQKNYLKKIGEKQEKYKYYFLLIYTQLLFFLFFTLTQW